jgi:hypothetical protein
MAPGAPLEFTSSTFDVTTCLGEKKLLSELDLWELLNLKSSTILDIPGRLCEEYGISSTYLDDVMKDYIIQTISREPVDKVWGVDQPPQIFVAATKHYSWPKSAGEPIWPVFLTPSTHSFEHSHCWHWFCERH